MFKVKFPASISPIKGDMESDVHGGAVPETSDSVGVLVREGSLGESY